MLDNGRVYLRALEPTDIDVIHRWENDCDLWRFGCATAPFSRHQIWEYLKKLHCRHFCAEATPDDGVLENCRQCCGDD